MTRKLRMMSPGGDTTLAEWETETLSPERLKEIEKEFNKRLKQGYFAADITEGRNTLVKEFDPKADTLLVPRVQGG